MPKHRNDKSYRKIVLEPIYVCAKYQPKFGQGKKKGLTLEAFQTLYKSDPFYNWLGLDNPLMYASHKAAGGMTSIYRLIGIGCERLFRRILMDSLGLTENDATWWYARTTTDGKKQKLYLDGRIPLDAVGNQEAQERVENWIKRAAQEVGVKQTIIDSLIGVVFEVRQGYKSKDSKRQNADIANAATAYVNAYLPCVVVFSNQIDGDILHRYREEKWAIVTGVVGTDDSLRSTYAFSQQVLGYDLAGFFERNSKLLRKEVDKVLRSLLKTS